MPAPAPPAAEVAKTAEDRVRDDFVVYEQLRGHKGQVLCVSASNPKGGEALVATGAEDSTVRLWDLGGGSDIGSPSATPACLSGSIPTSWSKPRVVLCICRCFDGEPVSSVVFGPGGADRLYCSAGSKVFHFDLLAGRKSGLLLMAPTGVFDDGSEEVNEVAVHPKGEYLAAADDSGVVKIFNTRTRRLHKILRNAHASICNTVRFRPRTSWDVASGALDSTLVLWDFNSGRTRKRVNLAEDAAASAASKSNTSGHQLFNPPFVHSVDFTPDGRYLAAGLGDSGVVIFDAKTWRLVGRCDGHSAPVSQVHYPVFETSLLISTGNDRRLVFWDHRPFERPPGAASSTNSSIAAADLRLDKGRRKSQPFNACLPINDSIREGSIAQQHQKPQPKAGKKKKGRGGKAADRSSEVSPGYSETFVQCSCCSRDAGQRGCEGKDEQNGDGGGEDTRACRESLEGRGRGRNDDEAGVCPVQRLRPSSESWLHEKPNWISSITVPYVAVLVADTSSEVKILRRRSDFTSRKVFSLANNHGTHKNRHTVACMAEHSTSMSGSQFVSPVDDSLSTRQNGM